MIRQTFSQKTWPRVGDIDDCWVISTIQGVNAVAPWLPLLTCTEFRTFAGDPDDGTRDGGNVDEIMKGITGAYPRLAPLVTAVRGWTWDKFLAELKVRRIATVCVSSAKLPLQYGFTGLHQVLYEFVPSVGLYIANPLAPDRSALPRIATASAKEAAEAYGSGKVYAVLMPTEGAAFTTHPLYVPAGAGKYTEEQVAAMVSAATKATAKPLQDRIDTMHGLGQQIVQT